MLGLPLKGEIILVYNMNGEVMNIIYTKVDTQFLNKLDLQVRLKLENLIQQTPRNEFYIMMCPYCNVFFIIPVLKGKR